MIINPCYNLVVQSLNIVGDLYLMKLKWIDSLKVVKSQIMLDSDLYNVKKKESLRAGVDTLTRDIDTCIPRFDLCLLS